MSRTKIVLLLSIPLILAFFYKSCGISNEFFPTEEGLMPVVLFEIDLKDRSSWDLQKKAEFDFPGYYKIVADLKKLRDSSYDSINVELSGELKIRNSNGVVLWNNTFQIPLIKNQVGAEIAYFNLKDFGKTGNEYYFELSVEGKDLSFLYSHLTVYIRKRYIHSFLD